MYLIPFGATLTTGAVQPVECSSAYKQLVAAIRILPCQCSLGSIAAKWGRSKHRRIAHTSLRRSGRKNGVVRIYKTAHSTFSYLIINMTIVLNIVYILNPAVCCTCWSAACYCSSTVYSVQVSRSSVRRAWNGCRSTAARCPSPPSKILITRFTTVNTSAIQKIILG